MTAPTRTAIPTASFAALLALAILVLGHALLDDTGALDRSADQRSHYAAGRLASAGIFLAAYVSLLLRLIVAPAGAAPRLALWFAPLLAAALAVALGLATLLGLAKETIDLGSYGRFDLDDLAATAAGATSILPAIAVLMVVSPFLISWSRGASASFASLASLRRYAAVREVHDAGPDEVDVLLVEDDVVCATVAMRFCARHRLACRHVETLADADRVLRTRASRIRLVLLDLFVRVGEADAGETGADWLARLEASHPRASRTFRVVVLSGHVRHLGAAARLADLALEKPWHPADLERFLRTHGIV